MKYQRGILEMQTGLIALAIGAVLVGGVWLKIASLNSTISDLKTTNKNLADENAQLVLSNETNVKTIESLKTQKKDIEKALDDLRIQKARDNKELSKLRGDIDTIVKADPTKNGTVSPILKDTINIIQNSHKPKVEVKK